MEETKSRGQRLYAGIVETLNEKYPEGIPEHGILIKPMYIRTRFRLDPIKMLRMRYQSRTMRRRPA